jgi:hypothetical protein
MKLRTRRRVSISSSRIKAFSSFINNFSAGFKSGWLAKRPGFIIANNKATSALANYPIQTVQMSSENVTSKIVNNTENSGSGIALWVKDALNWWGIASKQVDSGYSYTYACNCGTSSYDCNCSTSSYDCNCSTSSYSCNCSTNGPYGVQCSTNGPFYGGFGFYYTYSCSFYYYTYTCGTCYSYSCGTCYSYSCNTCYSYSCGSCSANGTTNNYYLKLYNSVSGTVSEVASVTLSAVAKSIQVITNGLGITGKAYSDTGFSSQTGDTLTYTAPSGSPSKLHGIIIAESTQNQSYTIDSFESSKN